MLAANLLDSTPYSLKYGKGVSVKDYVEDLQEGNVKHVSKSSNYTTNGEVIIGVDTSSSAVTITLATADCKAGKVVIINDEGGNAGTNNITVATEGSETIDGSATATISSNNGTLRLYSDGSNWFSW